MINKTEFLERIKKLPEQIPSKTGTAFYSGFKLEGNILNFHRVNPQTNWSLDVDQLWQVYCTQEFINTTVVKNVTGGRANSPAVAILMAIGCINRKGNRK